MRGHCRRVRLGQINVGFVVVAFGGCAQPGALSRRDTIRRPRHSAHEQQRAAPTARSRRRDDFAGPDDLAGSGIQRGQTGGGSDSMPRQRVARRTAPPCRRCADPRAYSRTGKPRAQLSPSIERRHAPAGSGRHCRGLRAQTVNRRRAHHVTGRHHSGPVSTNAARRAKRFGHEPDCHHA